MATLLLVHAHPDDEAISTGGVMLKARAEGHRVVLDRKSTRLNSSHLVISYAVFCLKKKTHLHPHHQSLKHPIHPNHIHNQLPLYHMHSARYSALIHSSRAVHHLTLAGKQTRARTTA